MIQGVAATQNGTKNSHSGSNIQEQTINLSFFSRLWTMTPSHLMTTSDKQRMTLVWWFFFYYDFTNDCNCLILVTYWSCMRAGYTWKNCSNLEWRVELLNYVFKSIVLWILVAIATVETFEWVSLLPQGYIFIFNYIFNSVYRKDRRMMKCIIVLLI